jgi:transposase
MMYWRLRNRWRFHDRLGRKENRNLAVGINEYCTSQTCPRCFGQVDFVRRPVSEGGWSSDPGEIDKEGKVPIYRLLKCEACRIHSTGTEWPRRT